MNLPPLIGFVDRIFLFLSIQHQYGNYIIQHVMENGKSYYKSQIVNSVRGKVFLFALQKHARWVNLLKWTLSHVLLLALSYGTFLQDVTCVCTQKLHRNC